MRPLEAGSARGALREAARGAGTHHRSDRGRTPGAPGAKGVHGRYPGTPRLHGDTRGGGARCGNDHFRRPRLAPGQCERAQRVPPADLDAKEFAMITGKLRGALYLGLDGENITRLVAGEPIRVSPARMVALGFPRMTVVIHYGKTQESLINEVTAFGEEIVGGDSD